MKISTIQIQKPILAPSLQQSIEVLLLPIMDLNLTIDQELQSNPLLEMDETNPDYLKSQKDRDLYQKLEQLNKTRISQSNEDNSDEEQPEERPIIKNISLEEYLLKQLRLEVSDPQILKIGESIIGNIDEDGYLKLTCEDIAESLGLFDQKPIEKTLNIIQNFDPIGIASRDLKECLLTQIKQSQNLYKNLAISIIKEYLNELGRKKYVEMARKLKVSVDEIKDAHKLISSLEPKPARNYRPVENNIYIKPDVLVRKDTDGNYQVIVNQGQTPPLRINPLYKNLLHNPKMTREEKDFIKEKLTNALNFIRSISQRGQTIRKITEHIVAHQRDFFEYGDTSLAPMSLKNMAELVDRNESTVSRAINNKYMDTPHGLYPIKFFFSQAIPSEANSDNQTSVQSIKEEIKEMVDQEDKSSPLSDQALQYHFEKQGMHLARRTVSKYRQALRIPPSYLRKE